MGVDKMRGTAVLECEISPGAFSNERSVSISGTGYSGVIPLQYLTTRDGGPVPDNQTIPGCIRVTYSQSAGMVVVHFPDGEYRNMLPCNFHSIQHYGEPTMQPDRLKSELEAVKDVNDRLRHENDQLTAKCHMKQELIDALNTTILDLRGVRDGLIETCEIKQQVIEAQKVVLAELRRVRDELHEEVKALTP
jgi:hypothetical protein